MSTKRRLEQPATVLFALLLAVSSITMVAASGPPTNVHDASFPRSDSTAPGWAVGDDGNDNAQILRQNSNGIWQIAKTFNNKVLNSIVMISAHEGYAVGNGGFIAEYHGSGWQG